MNLMKFYMDIMPKESNKGIGASHFSAMSNTNAQTYEMGAH
jgi:hypothetical protein